MEEDIVEMDDSESDEEGPRRRAPKRLRQVELFSETPSPEPEPEEAESEPDTCIICFQEYTNAAPHTLASLKCGHFFGANCIEQWLATSKTCPTCKRTSQKRDIRRHFGKAVQMLDTAELVRLKTSNDELLLKMRFLEHQDVKQKIEIHTLRCQIDELNKAAAARQRNEAAKTVQPAPTESTSFEMVPKSRIQLTDDRQAGEGASLRAFDFLNGMYVFGIKNSRTMFNPYSLRFANAERNLRTNESFPVHCSTIRLVEWNRYAHQYILTGSEDHTACVFTTDGHRILRRYEMPCGTGAVRGTWTSATKFIIGTVRGRVYEFDVSVDSSIPTATLLDDPSCRFIVSLLYLPLLRVYIAATPVKVFALPQAMPEQRSLLFDSHGVENQGKRLRSVLCDDAQSTLMLKMSQDGEKSGSCYQISKVVVHPNSNNVTLEDSRHIQVESSSVVTSRHTSCDLLFSWGTSAKPQFTTIAAEFAVVFNESSSNLELHELNATTPKKVVAPCPKAASGQLEIMAMRWALSGEGNEQTCLLSILAQSNIYIFSLRRGLIFRGRNRLAGHD